MPTYTYDWVGLTNDDPWPATEWAITAGSNGETSNYIDVQSERGRMNPATTNRSRRANALTASTAITMDDVEIDTTFEIVAGAGNELGMAVAWRTNGVWNNDAYGGNEILPDDGYALRCFADGRVWLRRMAAGVTEVNHINGETRSSVVGAGTTSRVRLQHEGSTIRLKLWVSSTAEPAEWETFTDGTYTTGNVGIGAASGGTHVGTVLFDGVDVYDLAAVAGIAHTRTIRSTTVGTLS